MKAKQLEAKPKGFLLGPFLASLFFVLLMIPLASAANLEGAIYSYQLEELENVLLTIDTVPEQQILSTDGTYSFSLDPGTYTLTARFADLETEEQITIDKEGDFHYDLFLFPSFAAEDELWNDLELTDDEEENPSSANDAEILTSNQNGNLALLIAAIALIFASITLFVVLSKRKRDSSAPDQSSTIPEIKIEEKEAKEKETEKSKLPKVAQEKEISEQDPEPGYLDRTLKIIKDHDGRISQKELRKEMIEISESKISLILTELEHKGKVEKVKRGRGNVILLKETEKIKRIKKKTDKTE